MRTGDTKPGCVRHEAIHRWQPTEQSLRAQSPRLQPLSLRLRKLQLSSNPRLTRGRQRLRLDRGGLAKVSDATLGLDLSRAGVHGFGRGGLGSRSGFGNDAAASEHARTNVAFGRLADSAVDYCAVARIASGIRSQCVVHGDIENSFIEGAGCSNVAKVNGGKGRDRLSSALALGRAPVASRNDVCSPNGRSCSGRSCSGSSDPRRSAMGGRKGRSLVQRTNQNAVGHNPAKPSASSRSIRFPRNNFVTWLV